MRSIKPILAAKTCSIVVSTLFCLLGLLLLIYPGVSVSIVGIAAAIMLIGFGVTKLTGFFSRDLYRLAFQYDLASGILLVALGTLLLMSPDHAMSFLCLILGIAVTVDGWFKVQMALDARRFGLKSWWLILTTGVLTGLIGLVVAFRPTASAEVLMMLLGVSLLAEGLMTLCVTLCAVKIVRNQQPDVIEAEFEEHKL